MKAFMSNVMTKLNKKILAIFAAALGALTFLIGILTICQGAREGCGLFINSIIVAILFLVLAYEINKGEKKKSLILVFVLMADFIGTSVYLLAPVPGNTSLGASIGYFITSGDAGQSGASGLMITTYVFEGLGSLVLFGAATIILIATLNDNVNKDNCNFIADCLFFVAGIFYFIVSILVLCDGGDGLSLVTAFFKQLFLAGQAVFFAFETYALSNENAKVKKVEETKEEPASEETK